MSTAPIFILSCGGRTGSTWVSRLLTSTKGVLIWGESNLFKLRFDYLNSTTWTDEFDCGKDTDLHHFRKVGTNAWMAQTKPFQSDFDAAFAYFLEDVFGKPARREGYPRWGLKEVHWQIDDVSFIRKHWPSANVIFLTRNFLNCYQSAVGTTWMLGDVGRQGFMREWIRTVSQLVSLDLRKNERHFRYEDLLERTYPLTDWCRLLDAKPLDYVSPSSAPLLERDIEIARPYSAVINQLSERLGYEPLPF